MNVLEPFYRELENRLSEAGAALAALQARGDTEAVHDREALLARLRDAENALKQVENELGRNIRRHSTELAATNQRLLEEIEARRLAEQRLQEANDALRFRERILNETGRIARIGGWEHDLASGRVTWTAAVFDILGLPLGEPLTFDAFLKCYETDDRAAFESAYQQAVETGAAFNLTLKCSTADERTIWVRAKGKPVQRDGRSVAVRGTLQDVTAQRATNTALRKTQYMVEQAGLGIYQIGPDGRILDANEYACASLGYSRDELLKMTVFDIDPTFSPQEWLKHRNDIPVYASKTLESVHRRKDGTTFPVEVTVGYTEFEGERFSASFVRDISESKQSETQRKALEAQLIQAQKMEAIGQLAGGVAHDFNNILMAIMGNIELARLGAGEKGGNVADLLDALKQVELGAERAAALTRQLLTFSRRQSMRVAAIDLNAVIVDIDNMLRRLLTENIKLETVTADEPVVVLADRGQIEQVAMNLIVNARDAMPQGGTIRLEVQTVTLDDEFIAAHPGTRTGKHVRLSVTDTGIGMDEDTRDRVFEPFFTTKELGKGTGLGLAIVYGIVRQSNGCVDVESAVGQGTSFRIHLPVVDQPVESVAPLSDDVVLGGDDTILLCEDDDAVRELAASMLSSAGYEVIVCANGREALTVAAQRDDSIDLLVADVIMPDIDGTALYRDLRKDRPDLRALFITGYASYDIADRDALSDPAAYLQKPFSRNTLLSRVWRILDQDDSGE